MALQNIDLKGKTPTNGDVPLPIDGVAWSTNIPLVSDEVISTPWIKIGAYKSLHYIIQSDQSGIIEALEYSTDGENVSSGGTARAYTDADKGKLLQTFVALKDNYFRMRYRNGSIAQTKFFFATFLSTTVGQNTMNSVFLAITPTNVASITKSVIELNDGSDVYGQVHRTGDSLNVHVDNLSDQPAPIVNVAAPIVNVPAPNVNVAATDTSTLSKDATLTNGNQKTQISAPLPIGTNNIGTVGITGTTLTTVGTDVAQDVYVSGGQLNVAVVSNESRDFIHQQTILGNVYMWSSGVIAGLVALTNIRAYINNPVGSGKTLTIFALILDNGSATPQFATVLANPTTNLPVASKGTGTNMNMGFSGIPSPFTAYADTGGAMTGGVAVPSAFAAANMRTEFLEDQQVFIVPPGGKIGFNFPITGVTNSFQVVIYGIVT